MTMMMQRLRDTFQSLFDAEHYANRLELERANLVYGVLLTELVLLIMAGLAPIWGSQRQIFYLYAQQDPSLLLYPLSLVVGVISGFALIRYQHMAIASFIAISISIVLIVRFVLMSANPSLMLALIMLSALIIISGLLLGHRGLLASALFTTVAMTVIVWNSLSRIQLFELVPVVIFLILVTGINALYQRFVSISREVGIDEFNVERIKFAEFISEISTRASQRMPLRDLLAYTVNLILEKYPQFYHAQVFLLDERGGQARLIASTGEPGKILLEKNHSLNVGSMSVIGEVTGDGKPKIELAGGTVHRFNSNLPATKLEAAFPLRIGTQVIGALDLQSNFIYKFGRQDIATFQSLADSLSLVIDNVRQYESAVERVQENQALAEQARSALREVDRLNKRLIGRAWTEFLRTQASGTGIDLDAQTQVITPHEEWTDTLTQAAVQNKTVQQQNIVAVPLRLRGQVIGAMEFEIDEKGEFSQEDLELIEEIGERFGLAAENTRLVEESQRVAQREALINEISSRMQASNNVEATLTEAARSLRETLQAHRVMIRLGSPVNAAPKGMTPNASR